MKEMREKAMRRDAGPPAARALPEPTKRPVPGDLKVSIPVLKIYSSMTRHHESGITHQSIRQQQASANACSSTSLLEGK